MRESWLLKVAVIGPSEIEHLLSESEYQSLLAKQTRLL